MVCAAPDDHIREEITMYDFMQNVTSPAASHEGWYGSGSPHVARFLAQLRCIPAAEWLRVTDTPERAIDGDAREAGFDRLLEEQANVAARFRLCQALEAMPHVVRRISERINHDLAVFRGIIPPRPLLRMQRMAHLAAFGLAARNLLDREDVARLYRPFAELIPMPRDLVAG